LPEVPAVAEFVPGYEESSWYGVGVPKTTPTEIANNPQQSWGFGGEPPEAVIKDSGTRDGTS
jgi:hypothetical protein